MDFIQILERAYSQYGYLLVFFGSLLESLVLLGFLLPGGIVVLLSGYFSRQGDLMLLPTLLLAWTGMFFGDLINYWLGKESEWLFRHPKLASGIKSQEKIAKEYLKRYGLAIIFYSHVIGYLRSIVGFTAGAIKVSPRLYTLAVFCASFLWSALFVLLGYFWGGTATNISDINKKVETFSLGLAALFIGLKVFEKLTLLVLGKSSKK